MATTAEIKEFRDGIFALRTRRFGTVAEIMIKYLYNMSILPLTSIQKQKDVLR